MAKSTAPSVRATVSPALPRGYIVFKRDALILSSRTLCCALNGLDVGSNTQCTNLAAGARFFGRGLQHVFAIDERLLWPFVEKRAQKPVSEAITHGQAGITARFSLLQKELTDFELLETDVRAKRLPLLAASARAFDDELRRFVAAEGADLLPLVISAVQAPGSLQSLEASLWAALAAADGVCVPWLLAAQDPADESLYLERLPAAQSRREYTRRWVPEWKRVDAAWVSIFDRTAAPPQDLPASAQCC